MIIKDIEQLERMLQASEAYMSSLTRDFKDKNERILYRKPANNSDNKYPEVTDNTLASYIEKSPKNVIQKIPDYKISTNSNKIIDIASEFVAKKIIAKSGSAGYGFLQKQWIAFRNASAFGMNAVALPFLFTNEEYTVGFENIFWGDLRLEPYCSNINSSNWVMYRTMYSELDIQEILDDQDEDIDDGWDRKVLKEMIDFNARETPSEDSKQGAQNVSATVDGMFETYVYSSKYETIAFHRTHGILRRVDNPSRKRRVIGLYYDYDGINPMGRSLIDFSYDQQVMIDFLLQSYLYQVAYNLDPALIVEGTAINEDNFDISRGNVIITGNEETRIKTVDLDNTTIQNFPSIYSLLKSQMVAGLPASNDTSISASIGNPGFSKTQAGVKNQDRKEEIETNYSRKNYETFFELFLENSLNIWFNELREGGETIAITLDDEYASLIREVDPEAVNEDNVLLIDLDGKIEINVVVDFESTRAVAKEEDMKRLSQYLTMIMEAAKADEITSEAVRDILPTLTKLMTKNSNIEDSDELGVQLENAIRKAKENKAQQQQIENDQAQQQIDIQAQGGMPNGQAL